ncbi:MAG: FAD-dependent oxidoreductase [Rickettsiales bacterium]|jgi:thioredoxin reductase (NADPH)|nr:FAD-dependent oxidoreductase [Rickettsiales bacterium]
MKFDIVILGSGPAGLASALYSSRAGRKVSILGGTPGGQMGRIAELENYPGTHGRISGMDLFETMKNQAVGFGAEFMGDSAENIQKGKESYIIKTTLGNEIEARAVIVATGAEARRLGVPGEAEFTGRGVSFCATCDGNFYKNMTVIVVGGGNSALSEALHLSHIAKSVIISYRKGEFSRTEKILNDRVASRPNIRVEFNSEIAEIAGGDFVQKVIMKDGREIPADGVFIAIGHIPNTGFLPGGLPLDADGRLITIPNKTQIEGTGIFAAGDVRSGSPKQAIVAAGQGAQAAMEANEYLG